MRVCLRLDARTVTGPHAQRHGDAEVGARELAIDDLHRTAVGRYELEYHRESDTGAFYGRGARRASGIEGLEHVSAVLERNPGTAVGDIEHQLRACGASLQVDGAPFRRILHGVGDEVLEYQADLAAVGDQGQVLDANIETHALREQRQLLVLEHLLDERTEAELGGLEADARSLPGAEGQEVLDHALQLDAVLAQDRRHLTLVGIELADRTIHQELGALANIGERRFELVRHVAQEAVALVRQIEETLAQPLQLPAEPLEIVGT